MEARLLEHHCLILTVQGGSHHSLQACGVGSNKKKNQRAGEANKNRTARRAAAPMVEAPPTEDESSQGPACGDWPERQGVYQKAAVFISMLPSFGITRGPDTKLAEIGLI